MEGKKLAGTILSASCRTLIFVLLLMLLYFLGRKAFAFGKEVFAEKSMTDSVNAVEVTVTIDEEQTIDDVAQTLLNAGLIDDTTLFLTQLRLSDYYGKFVAGTYILKTDMKPSEIMAALCVNETDAEGK